MEIERSCGAVVFTREHNEYKFVVIQSLEGTYGFPKGHMKGYETERQTALREVKEETGLTVELLPDFREPVEYIIPANGHLKKVMYFLGRYADQRPVPQPEEVRKILLLKYDDAMKIFQYENNRTLLQKAYRTILKKKY